MKGKRILFEIAHPKHFHQFKPMMRQLAKENDIFLIARDKDVVLNLVQQEDFPYAQYGRHGKSLFQKIALIPNIIMDYWRICRKFKPDYIISRSSPYSAVISKFSRAKTIIFPDSEIVPLINKFVAPNSHLIITPDNFSRDYGLKHHRVKGFFEEAYLHPQSFIPDSAKLKEIGVEKGERYFLLRFVGWFANHDVNQQGFTTAQKRRLIGILEKQGKVFISSEGKIDEEFTPYLLKANPKDIHHYLHFADIYIGDSQTMATEAALLGTPAIRFNSFVGENDMSNFIILEKDLDLLRNVSSYEQLEQTLTGFLERYNLKAEWLDKRENYFGNKTDITEQSINLLNLLN